MELQRALFRVVLCLIPPDNSTPCTSIGPSCLLPNMSQRIGVWDKDTQAPVYAS